MSVDSVGTRRDRPALELPADEASRTPAELAPNPNHESTTIFRFRWSSPRSARGQQTKLHRVKRSSSGGPRRQSKEFCRLGGARPVVRIASKRSFADSNPGPRSLVECNEAPAEIKVTTRSRRASRARRQKREKRRHRFLPSLHSHGGHRFRLFCGCCVEQDAIDPAETPSSFHWGVGFDDSYYHSSSYQQNLSKGTRFRLELCGLHVATRGKDLSVDISTVGARAASLDSGFGYTCASPVSCPPPHGLVPTRTFPTTLKLRSRDGTGNGKFTLHTGTSGFASTGFKRKAPSSSSYPSYTPRRRPPRS